MTDPLVVFSACRVKNRLTSSRNLLKELAIECIAEEATRQVILPSNREKVQAKALLEISKQTENFSTHWAEFSAPIRIIPKVFRIIPIVVLMIPIVVPMMPVGVSPLSPAGFGFSNLRNSMCSRKARVLRVKLFISVYELSVLIESANSPLPLGLTGTDSRKCRRQLC